jgi:DNA-directed RNA polymerase subunit RPC12/RpoP
MNQHDGPWEPRDDNRQHLMWYRCQTCGRQFLSQRPHAMEMNQEQHERPPERMADRCPLCTQRIGASHVVLHHLVTVHKRSHPEAEELIRRYSKADEG